MRIEIQKRIKVMNNRKQNKIKKYLNNWLILVELNAKKGFNFEDITDGKKNKNKILGGWANVIIKAQDIFLALEILKKGLNELNFEVSHVDRVENVQTLVENKEINTSLKSDIDWLNASNFVFKILDKIFPYTNK